MIKYRVRRLSGRIEKKAFEDWIEAGYWDAEKIDRRAKGPQAHHMREFAAERKGLFGWKTLSWHVSQVAAEAVLLELAINESGGEVVAEFEAVKT